MCGKWLTSLYTSPYECKEAIKPFLWHSVIWSPGGAITNFSLSAGRSTLPGTTRLRHRDVDHSGCNAAVIMNAVAAVLIQIVYYNINMYISK